MYVPFFEHFEMIYKCENINKFKQKVCVCHLFIIKAIYHKDASWREIIFFPPKNISATSKIR